MKTLLSALTGMLLAGSASADIIISQYYEGASNNKWIELANTGSSSLTLTGYRITLWSNALAENYKSDGNTPTASLDLSGVTINHGDTYLLANTGAVLPSYAAPDLTNGTVINFNGNDSVVLYDGTTYNPANILDAIGFTNAGNEGANLSFARISASAGWDTGAGSNATSFGSVWQSFSNTAVDDALPNTNERLGYSTVAIPEPATAGLLGLAGALALLRRRTQR